MNTKEKIVEKMELLKKYADYLKSKSNIKKQQLEDDYTLLSSIERNLQLAIECVLDIGEIIISEKKLKKPESYKEVIEILGEKNILPKEFAEKFSLAASFRNVRNFPPVFNWWLKANSFFICGKFLSMLKNHPY